MRVEQSIEPANWYNVVNSIAETTIFDTLVIEDPNPEIPLEGRIPVLMVHGWNPNVDGYPTGGMWDNLRNYMAERADMRDNFKPYIVKYWSNIVSVKELGSLFSREMEKKEFYDKKVIILAHSMGGLVSRSFMLENNYTQGPLAGQQCGSNVKMLLTLGTPHHGSPLANKDARDAQAGPLVKGLLSVLEDYAFKGLSYDKVNRSDMLWDNYDNLLNLWSRPNEVNSWLQELNRYTTFDSRTVCYSGDIEGGFKLNPSTDDDAYDIGSYLIRDIFELDNDGIVPFKSATFDGHTVKQLRHFAGYNHKDINVGKGDNKLFDAVKTDLLPFIPLQVEQPDADVEYLRGKTTFVLKWRSPNDVEKVNILLSTDNGLSYTIVASNVMSALEEYNWSVPEINSDECIIRVENAVDNYEYDLSDETFSIYNNTIAIDSIGYVVCENTQTVTWNQEGLGNSVRISYVDNVTGNEKVIAENQVTSISSNSFDWVIDETYLPSESVQLKFELTDMAERYGDSTNYTWYSNKFVMLGAPTVSVSISDSVLEICHKYTVDWSVEGEVDSLSMALCDSLGNELMSIYGLSTQPSVFVEDSYLWEAPNYRGSSFRIKATAMFEGQAVASSFIDKYISINSYPTVLSPADGSSDVSLIPCVSMVDNNALSYNIELENNGLTKSFTSTSSTFCIPDNAADELLIGNQYDMSVTEVYANGKSYTVQTSFTTEKVAPDVFAIVQPAHGDSIENHSFTVNWIRSVGADSYGITIKNKGQVVYSAKNLSKFDTLVVVDFGDNRYEGYLFITVEASNEVGTTKAQSHFFDKRFTSVEQSKELDFNLQCYPNPAYGKTNVLFTVPGEFDKQMVTLDIFDVVGNKIAKLVDSEMLQGSYNYEWNIDEKCGGLYFIRLTVGKEKRVMRLIIK